MSVMTDPYRGLPDPELHAQFYADVPAKRFFAWVIDSVLIALLTLVAVPFTAFTALFYLPVLWLLVGVAYRIVTLTRGSATPGMSLMAIEFRTHRGERLDLTTATLHTLLYSVFIGVMVLQVVSIVLMLTTPRRQGLHDHLLGTAAINRAAAV